MPIQRVNTWLHIRRQSNAMVWRNIERLNDIASRDYPHHDLLAQLYPWGNNPSLKFNNGLSLLIFIAASFSLLSLVLFPVLHVPTIIGITITMGLGFLAYLLYESPSAVRDAVMRLEEDVIRSLYQIQQGKLPEQQVLPLRASMLMSQMQIIFPLFQQGDLSNAIHAYAAATWQGRSGKNHPVLLFQYHYVNQVETQDKNGKHLKIKEKHFDRWGVLVFEGRLQGLAISSLGRFQSPDFGHAYAEKWQTSDIDTNQKINIFCSNPMQAAKALDPVTVLGLNQLFEKHRGVLMCHPNQAVMCFLGEQNLLEHANNRPKIQDISQLRGHLRTFRLYPYEQLQQAMLKLLP